MFWSCPIFYISSVRQSLNRFNLHVRNFPCPWRFSSLVSPCINCTLHNQLEVNATLQLQSWHISTFHLHSMVKTIDLRFSVSALLWLCLLCFQQLYLNSNSCFCSCVVQQQHPSSQRSWASLSGPSCGSFHIRIRLRESWETVGWQENLGLSPKRSGKYRHSESLSNPYYNAKLITCEEHKMLHIKPSKQANFPHQIANLLPIHLTYLDPVEIV